MLLAIDVGNTETVIGLYALGDEADDDAGAPEPGPASASASRTSRCAACATTGGSPRSPTAPPTSTPCC